MCGQASGVLHSLTDLGLFAHGTWAESLICRTREDSHLAKLAWPSQCEFPSYSSPSLLLGEHRVRGDQGVPRGAVSLAGSPGRAGMAAQSCGRFGGFEGSPTEGEGVRAVQ